MKKRFIPFIIALFSTTLLAQLSPGDLSKPHAVLEGLKNCTKCHQIGEKVSAEKCLDCHTILRNRIQSRKGLHAQPGYDDCVLCHSDHQGKNFDLIYWKEGQENFDHKKTGFELQGRHSSVTCRQCHQLKNIAAPNELKQNNKDLNKTFLGLEQNCLSCHTDEHHGQLSRDCLTCHQMIGWKPAAKFDHSRSRFPLSGKHRTVPCISCHPKIEDRSLDGKKGFLKFSGLAFKNCTSCHTDPHNNRLGPQCSLCHNLSGWKAVKNKSFDHDRTRFPLKGKHATISCEKCHHQNRSLSHMKFNVCRDCHADYHQGQFMHRRQKGACEECHTVEGFRPATFTVDQHNQSDYRLEGAHLAVPCDFCHQKTYQGTLRFTFESVNCVICHSDPHQGTANQYVQQIKQKKAKDTCQFCHAVQSWMAIEYDHSHTGFKLEGKHLTIPCSSCHQSKHPDRKTAKVEFKIGKKECEQCHNDIHMGQFSSSPAEGKEKSKMVQCDRCHNPLNWSAVNFDHNRDSRFDLQGAHLKLPCSQCHKTRMIKGEKTVLYKPMEITCSSCHVNRQMNQ